MEKLITTKFEEVENIKNNVTIQTATTPIHPP